MNSYNFQNIKEIFHFRLLDYYDFDVDLDRSIKIFLKKYEENDGYLLNKNPLIVLVAGNSIHFVFIKIFDLKTDNPYNPVMGILQRYLPSDLNNIEIVQQTYGKTEKKRIKTSLATALIEIYRTEQPITISEMLIYCAYASKSIIFNFFKSTITKRGNKTFMENNSLLGPIKKKYNDEKEKSSTQALEQILENIRTLNPEIAKLLLKNTPYQNLNVDNSSTKQSTIQVKEPPKKEKSIKSNKENSSNDSADVRPVKKTAAKKQKPINLKDLNEFPPAIIDFVNGKRIDERNTLDEAFTKLVESDLEYAPGYKCYDGPSYSRLRRLKPYKSYREKFPDSLIKKLAKSSEKND